MRLRKTGDNHNWPTYRLACEPRCKASRDLRAWSEAPATCRSIRANTEGSPRPPGRRARAIRGRDRSQAPLHERGRTLQIHRSRDRLAVDQAIAQHHRLEFHWNVRKRLGVPEQKIATGLECVVETAQDGKAPFRRKIHEHVHAEDAVELSDVKGIDKIHLREGDQAADVRSDLIAVLRRCEIRVNLMQGNFTEAATR